MFTLEKTWSPIIGAGLGSGTSLSPSSGKGFIVNGISAGSAAASLVTVLAGTTPIARLYVPAAGTAYVPIGHACERGAALQIYGNGAVTYLTVSYEEF